jgi:hypothetical protein
MAGPRVVVLYEDKTGGGLHKLVEAMVKARRSDEGREPLAYFKPLAMKGNTKLVAECSQYQKMRFRAPHRADQVVAVIDAYRVEDAVKLSRKVNWTITSGDMDRHREQCRELDEEVRRFLVARALEGLTAERKEEEESCFHPIVLFWERESIFLAGGEILERTEGLRFPPEAVTGDGVMTTRCPTTIVDGAWKATFGVGNPYKKQIDGPKLFEHLRKARDCWETLRERVPSLREIIEVIAAF